MKHCMFWLSAYFIVWRERIRQDSRFVKIVCNSCNTGRASWLSTHNYEKCAKKVVPLFQFDHLPNSIAKIFAFCTWFRTCNNMKTLVWGFGCNIAACFKKSPENWPFQNQKWFFLFKTFGIFETWYDQMCPLFLWKIK